MPRRLRSGRPPPTPTADDSARSAPAPAERPPSGGDGGEVERISAMLIKVPTLAACAAAAAAALVRGQTRTACSSAQLGPRCDGRPAYGPGCPCHGHPFDMKRRSSPE